MAVSVFAFGVLFFLGASIGLSEAPHDLKKEIENAIPAFAEVEPGFFRSGAIPEDTIPFLKAYGIRTVINFDDRPEVAGPEAIFLGGFGIKTYNFPWKASENPSGEMVKETMALLTDKNLRPVLIHCYHGKDRTGLMVALYRVAIDKWTPDQAYAEMKTHGFHQFSCGHLKDFLYDYAHRNFGYEKPKVSVFEKVKTGVFSGALQLMRYISPKD